MKVISKDDVLKSFDKEDYDSINKVYDLMMISQKRDIYGYTKYFVKPNIWAYFIKKFNCDIFTVSAYGGYDECDRRIIAFNTDDYFQYPLEIIKIINKSKFNILKHKDYLGALMALGIEREKLGDLRVIDNYAIVPVCEDIKDYICSSLINVGNAPVDITSINDTDVLKSEFEELIIIIPSLRIDNFVAKLSKISRGKALELLDNKKVLVDYVKVKDKSKEMKEGQRITISSVGKFIVGNIVGNTKSGNFKVNVKKYL